MTSALQLERDADRGSNGVAIAPSNTLSHHALLLINPHTSFFFRAEVQVTSQEGLNAYGAVTWGQFFVYQGFNEHAGWMHSSTGADNIDEYLETVTRRGDHFVYRYGAEERPVTEEKAVVRYRTPQGMSQKDFTIYRTHHGPIVREMNGKWVSVRLMQRPMDALIQSFTRMKARDFKSFRQTMELHTNSSNNTTFADADGDIAYFHSNFIPRRDTSFDWTRPVDGSDPRTEWKGVLSVDESPNILNPPNGWVYNSNNWPWSAAGPFSPKRSDFPVYVELSKEESPRGTPRAEGSSGQERFHHRFTHLGRIRQLVAVIRADDSGAAQVIRRSSRIRSDEDEPRQSNRRAARMGLPLGHQFHPNVTRRLLGRGSVQSRRR